MRCISVMLLFFAWQALSAQRDSPCNSEIAANDSLAYSLVRLKINSEFDDYSPVTNGGEFLFVSGRNNRGLVEFRDKWSDKGTTDIFRATLLDPLRTGDAAGIKGTVNDRFHQGPFALSKTGDLLIYTSNNEDSPLPALWLARKKDGEWAKEGVADFCSDSHHYQHPSLSDKGDTVWFSSDQDGGYGGKDIYFSVFRNGHWGQSVNAGKRINTAHDEVFPFVSHRGLYFSSNRPGSGGLDLYFQRPRQQRDLITRAPEFTFRRFRDPC
jgi:peptidoglycan-associated lipoprotein